jgi:GNAT superfamily N-acetyltransferase
MVRIRPATSADPRAIAETQIEAWRSAYRAILPASYLAAMSPLQRESLWTAVVGGTSAVLLVAEDDDGIVGFACAGAARDGDVDPTLVGEISAIYLLERVWSAGVGRALFERACDALRERGFEEALLWVLEANERARTFYERMGMSLDDAAQAYFSADGERFREVRYRLRF